MNFKHYLNETTRRQKLRHSLHNIRTRDLTMGIVSPENPMGEEASEAENRESRREFKADLKNLGLNFFKTKGKYGSEETSYMIPGISLDKLKSVAKKFGQQSFIFCNRNEEGKFVFEYWEHDTKDAPYEKTKEETAVLNQQDEEDFYTILGDYKFKIPFKFEDRFLKKKKAQKTLKEGRLNEGTSNFDYDHRCVVVTDDDYEIGNVPAVDHDKDYGSRSYPRYPLADYGTEHFAVTLNPGYYEAACIDYCPKNSDYTDVKWYVEAAGKEYTAQMENRDPDEGDSLDWYDIDPEELLEAKEQEYFESAKNIELAAHQLEKTIEKRFRDEEVEVNRQIDEIMEEYGYDEYGVSARFSNGETMYSKISRKKTESRRYRGRML